MDGDVVSVPVLSLRPGESPRREGEDRAHVARLAESEAPLPPILVERGTMRVIDGMHRLLAASLRGQQMVDVVFFDGPPADAFLRAVQANVTHGLPLSLADRRAAAGRIVGSHGHMSDRAIGQVTGLAARTVAAIRRRSTGEAAQLNARVGRDGRIRPVSGVAGRERVAAFLAERPEASLREVARWAGVSPATAQDVRRRLERGEGPVPERRQVAGSAVVADGPAVPAPRGPARIPEPASTGRKLMPAPGVVDKLLRDPSLRQNEHGRGLLRMLQLNAVGAQEWPRLASAVPPHCAVVVMQLARQYAQMWLVLAQELEDRARVIDPLGNLRINGRN